MWHSTDSQQSGKLKKQAAADSSRIHPPMEALRGRGQVDAAGCHLVGGQALGRRLQVADVGALRRVLQLGLRGVAGDHLVKASGQLHRHL